MKTVLEGKKKTVINRTRADRPSSSASASTRPGARNWGEALLSGDMDYVRNEAIKQVEDGADVIDINVGVAGGDEEKLPPDGCPGGQRSDRMPDLHRFAAPDAFAEGARDLPRTSADQLGQWREASLARVLLTGQQFNTAVID